MATITMTMPMPGSKPAKKVKKVKKAKPQPVGGVARAREIEGPLVGMSRLIWSYLGYTGLIDPWHDNQYEAFRFQHNSILGLMDYLDEADVSLEAYSAFVFPVIPYERYAGVGKFLYNKGERSWMTKLRKYVKDQDELDYAADIFLQFIQLQVEHFGKAALKKSSIVRHDDNTKGAMHFEGYHRLIDRIRQLKSQDVDPEIWLEEKFLKAKEMFPKKPVLYRTIINVNALDPDIAELKQKSNDPWRDIRNFLGLSLDCELTDGYIPKGWHPSSDDRDELKRVVKLDGDGHYYYEDGTQRRGKRHYAVNSYFVIKCTPDNFEFFKEEWLDARRLTQSPTWDEYMKWGASPNLWDAEGNTTSGRGRAIKWRKR